MVLIPKLCRNWAKIRQSFRQSFRQSGARLVGQALACLQDSRNFLCKIPFPERITYMMTKYDVTKAALIKSADLAGLDDRSLAELIWRGEEQVLKEGQVVYVSGAKLDHTF